jgi:hypothetical protein
MSFFKVTLSLLMVIERADGTDHNVADTKNMITLA